MDHTGQEHAGADAAGADAIVECRVAAAPLNALLARDEAPGGTLRVFGDWFGKSYDNWHRPVSAQVVGTSLVVRFDGGEVLAVHEPRGVDLDPTTFRVRTASRVRWEWFHYGREQTAENLHVQEHWVEHGRVHASSTSPRYEPVNGLAPSLPAAELLSY